MAQSLHRQSLYFSLFPSMQGRRDLWPAGWEDFTQNLCRSSQKLKARVFQGPGGQSRKAGPRAEDHLPVADLVPCSAPP